MKASEKLPIGLISLLLAAAVFGVFWGALNCDFVNYDDPAYVTSNAHVLRGLTWPGVLWAVQTGAASNWHPLTWLSHMTDVSLFGPNPRWHHLTSLLLHAANCVLLFLLLQKLTGAMYRSAAVAALFALHPLRVESVVWISERKDLLSALFFLVTIWMYANYTGNSGNSGTGAKRGKPYYVLALLSFALALMAKPMVVTLPFVLLLLDYWPLGRMKAGRIRQSIGPLLLEKTPFFLLSIASSIITFVVQRKGGAVSGMAALSVGQRVSNAFVSYARYLGKIFWPTDLSILYPHPRDWPVWAVAASILLLALVSAWVMRRRSREPYLIVGWLLFLGMLVPAIGLVQVGIQSMADRYAYLPAVGVFIMVVWGLSDLLAARSWGRWALGCAGAAALAACVLLTPRQVRYWADSETLFKHAVAVTTDNYLAYNNIGFFLSNRNEPEEAMKYYKSSLEINPRYEDAHNNLGFALAALGRNQEAIDEYIKALSINSNLTEAHNNLGNALAAIGRNDEAFHEYQVALEENPHHTQAHNNLGIALATHGRLDEAIAQFQMAIRDKPDYASAHSDLGNVYAMQGKFDEATAQYQLCLKTDPNDPQVHNNLGNVLSQQGKYGEAEEHYRLALKFKSPNPEAHFNLAYCLSKEGRRAEAIEQYEKALAERPDYPNARERRDALKAAPQ